MDEEKPEFAYFAARDPGLLDEGEIRYGGPEFFVEAVPIKSWGKRCHLAYTTPAAGNRAFIARHLVCLDPASAIRKATEQTTHEISCLRARLKDAEAFLAALATDLPVRYPKRRG